MGSRVIRIDRTKHSLTSVVQWLERNVGLGIPVENGVGDPKKGRGWKLKTSQLTKKRNAINLRPIAFGLFCEFEDWVDDSIILYFALRFT